MYRQKTKNLIYHPQIVCRGGIYVVVLYEVYFILVSPKAAFMKIILRE